MPVHIVRDKYYIYKPSTVVDKKFRTELSKSIVDKFGKGPFLDQKIVREIVVTSRDYYLIKFKEICSKESSLTFYQNALWLHEQATELAFLHDDQDISPEISREYFAQYRRILKFILEMGCDVQMCSGEKTGQLFNDRIDPILDELLFIGEMIMECVSIYAEQAMIDDVTNVIFDEQGIFYFKRKHQYDLIFGYIIKELGAYFTKTVVDAEGVNHLKTALLNCFGIKYAEAVHLIAAIHKENGGKISGVEWEAFPINMENNFGVSYEIADSFFRGLRLDKNNKMDLLDLACKPYNLNRYLYRPIIIWTVDGTDYAFLGKKSWEESIIQYVTNAIPWGKAPNEWIQNDCFKKYVHSKEDEHDKWLENEVEERLQHKTLLYQRNVTYLNSLNGNIKIDVAGLGEVDFIIVASKLKKIFIADCKHLHSRYDIVNQKNDYNAFTISSNKKKSYNQTMTNKLAWFRLNKDLVLDHFKIISNDFNISFDDYLFEGIFVVNTPTFYMFNADYRIYTISQIEEVLLGNYSEPIFNIKIRNDGYDDMLIVKYPYFKKPIYLTF